jgi:two-component system sensor histidine kinase PilS (NtrC family)
MTDIIQRHSKRVNRIIENTLLISRRAEPRTEEIRLSDWLATLVEEYQEQRREAVRIRLDIQAPKATARFDPSQISQVLINLIDNGLKHGHAESDDNGLTVRLGQTPDGGQAYIEVIDQGPGISADNLIHLFEPFFTTAAQGTGLGLYLSREICEANQAQLDYIESGLPGACFRLMFAHYKRIV